MFSQSAVLIALGAAALAQAQIIGDSSSCPNGWSSNNIGDNPQIYCCPGSGIQIDDQGACCIGIGTVGPRQSCSTTVQYSDPNYSSIVSSLAAQTGGSSAPVTNADSTATDSSSSMVTSVAASTSAKATTSSSGSDPSSGSAAAQTSSSSSSSAAGVAVTGAPILANIIMGAAGAAMLL